MRHCVHCSSWKAGRSLLLAAPRRGCPRGLQCHGCKAGAYWNNCKRLSRCDGPPWNQLLGNECLRISYAGSKVRKTRPKNTKDPTEHVYALNTGIGSSSQCSLEFMGGKTKPPSSKTKERLSTGITVSIMAAWRDHTGISASGCPGATDLHGTNCWRTNTFEKHMGGERPDRRAQKIEQNMSTR